MDEAELGFRYAGWRVAPRSIQGGQSETGSDYVERGDRASGEQKDHDWPAPNRGPVTIINIGQQIRASLLCPSEKGRRAQGGVGGTCH